MKGKEEPRTVTLDELAKEWLSKEVIDAVGQIEFQAGVEINAGAVKMEARARFPVKILMVALATLGWVGREIWTRFLN